MTSWQPSVAKFLPMNDKKSPEEMLGESLREIGVLVVVFYGLSAFLKLEGLGWRELVGAALATMAGVVLWLIGTNLELKE